MESVQTVFQWYFYLFAIGLAFFPISRKIFPRFFDKGYAFSKAIAIVVLTYSSFILGIFKLVPFSQTSIYIIAIVFAVLNYFIVFRDFQLGPLFNLKLASKNKKDQRKKQGPRNNFSWNFILILVFEELLFLAALYFLAFTRGQEPSVRGLEKFMDFGFMNSILRSKFFPPIDMWLSADSQNPSGYPINYYYFGHLSGAYLIKLTGMLPAVGYNMVLATIFAQAVTMTFSLTGNIVNISGVFKSSKIRRLKVFFFGLLGSFLVNLAGNLHTIYVFTTGYENEKPVPFWNIFLPWSEIFSFGSGDTGSFGFKWFTQSKYWYPNATRFIPFTIHEFPSYSYVVADLHGHVFDIPFVLLTIALLFSIYLAARQVEGEDVKVPRSRSKKTSVSTHLEIAYMHLANYLLPATIFLGFLTAVHYMTNAFDGPIYMLLSLVVFFVLFSFTIRFFLFAGITIMAFVLFSAPFSRHFTPFVSGIGLNCSRDFLVNLKKLGPFMFEAGKCQASPVWMIFTLWGFFFISFIMLYALIRMTKKISAVDSFMLILFGIGTFLIIVPEFFYIKDIYPDHFRANTMFKLGYQAYIMMSIGSTFVLYRISTLDSYFKYFFKALYVVMFFLLLLYPFFSFPSYYGTFKKPFQLDGSEWLRMQYPEDHEIVSFFNNKVSGQPVILEAQGDSYTDYERISAYTGLPTVAGWWVHEWLWRGSADVVGKRIPDIVSIYESEDAQLTRDLLRKYNVQYVVVAGQERTKYPQLKEQKFKDLGEVVFQSSNKSGAVYKVK